MSWSRSESVTAKRSGTYCLECGLIGYGKEIMYTSCTLVQLSLMAHVTLDLDAAGNENVPDLSIGEALGEKQKRVSRLLPLEFQKMQKWQR